MSTESLRAGERIRFLIERDGKICHFPGCRNPTAFSNSNRATTDHWIPVSKGGEDIPENWRLMHQRCNQLKADRLVLPNGTLEPVIRNTKPVKIQKRDPCEECYDGRLLLEDETCTMCGSGPMPAKFPRYRQKVPKECDHLTFFCWACTLGFVEREQAYSNVFGTEGI